MDYRKIRKNIVDYNNDIIEKKKVSSAVDFVYILIKVCYILLELLETKLTPSVAWEKDLQNCLSEPFYSENKPQALKLRPNYPVS